MKGIVSSSGAGHMVEFVNDDFIALDPEDCTVKYILVDPSCSGSGWYLSCPHIFKAGENEIEMLCDVIITVRLPL